MAITNFVPDLWSAKILVALRKKAVAAGLVNRDYEGEIKRMGDSVKITSINDVTIGSYTAHNDITWEDIDDATRSLLIDQAKYFAFELDDIERAQAVNGGADPDAREGHLIDEGVVDRSIDPSSVDPEPARGVGLGIEVD